jgi:hypothetical protein
MAKIKVPEGMLKAVIDHHPTRGMIKDDPDARGLTTIEAIVEAALRWQRENAPMPTKEQTDAAGSEFALSRETCGSFGHWWAGEWPRRMYDAPELEAKTHLLGETFQKVIMDTEEYNSTAPGTALFWRNQKEWIVSTSMGKFGAFAGVSIRGYTPEFLKSQEEEKDGYSMVFIKIGGFGPGEKAVVK